VLPVFTGRFQAFSIVFRYSMQHARNMESPGSFVANYTKRSAFRAVITDVLDAIVIRFRDAPAAP
jgi:hypothetical protein